MNYEEFCDILNAHIFKGGKKELFINIVSHPERFIGLFRPTKPKTKVLQHILQSHEIRMGAALEEIVEKILKSFGFKTLNKKLSLKEGKILLLDQYFTDGEKYYFVEQKVRDDHDSTKKLGQMQNFKVKLELLSEIHKHKLVGILYFIDPDLSKNKTYYKEELKKLSQSYGVELHLHYGKEFFEFMGKPEIWDKLIQWLKSWKDSLPELPEMDFDRDPEDSYQQIKNINLRYWEKALKDNRLWESGIMYVIFSEGKTLRLVAEYFETQGNIQIANMIRERINKYYGG